MAWAAAAPYAIGALGSVASSLIGGNAENKGIATANEANAQATRENIEFQKEMSNTAIQRRVNDLKQAGLNPMLAYQQGGASAPTGAVAHYENEKAGTANSASQIAGTLISTMNMDKQRELLQAQADAAIAAGKQASAQAANISAATKLADGIRDNLITQSGIATDKARNEELMTQYETEISAMNKQTAQRTLEWTIDNAKMDWQNRKSDQEFEKSPVGRIINMLGDAAGVAGPIASIIRMFLPHTETTDHSGGYSDVTHTDSKGRTSQTTTDHGPSTRTTRRR